MLHIFESSVDYPQNMIQKSILSDSIPESFRKMKYIFKNFFIKNIYGNNMTTD